MELLTMNTKEREASAQVLKAMAHPVRLGVIELLADGERSVTELFTNLQCSQSVMSHQLGVLRAQGLISMRREGNTKMCSLRNRDFLRLFKCLESHVHKVFRID